MKKLSILIIVLIISATALFSQLDSCLIEPLNNELIGYTYYDEYFEGKYYNINTYGIKIDTCNSFPNNWIYYGKHFDTSLNLNIFPRDTVYDYDEDSLYVNIYYEIDDLPIKYNYLKPILETIELKFGKYQFYDWYREKPDTTESHPNRDLGLTFEDYNNLDSIYHFLMNLDFVDTLTWEMPSTISNVNVKKEIKINLFPNPAKHVICLISDKLINSIKIFNLSGTEIKKMQEISINQIDVSDLKTGTYFMIINNKYIHKFIKE
jgi:hypothetical protein